MVEHVRVTSGLAQVVGAPNVLPGSETYAVDGIVPGAVAWPDSYEAVAETLRFANGEQLAVIPLGGRTHAGLGNMPARYDVALDLASLNRVVEFEPADLTITCQAGMTLGTLRQTAAADGLMVPFDPAIPDDATIGGVLAANVSGPARVSLGAPRDFTIGMRVVTADGQLTRAGGRVVKNVAGYDMCKLYIGSLGTLGVIVEATFKTLPLPMAELSLGFDFESPEPACALPNEAYRRGLGLRSALVTRGQAGWRLSIGLAGTPAAVQRSEREIKKTAAGLGGKRSVVTAPDDVSGALVARVGVLPAQVAALLAEAPGKAEALPTIGACRLSYPDATMGSVEAARDLASRFGAPCVFERCVPALKADIDVFGVAPTSFALMESLKREFDPNGVLSPGRFVGRL